MPSGTGFPGRSFAGSGSEARPAVSVVAVPMGGYYNKLTRQSQEIFPRGGALVTRHRGFDRLRGEAVSVFRALSQPG